MKIGKLQIVGIGPGNYDMMTVQCVKALKDCDCIIGYDVYIDLVKEHFPDKEFKSTPMRKEEERCRLAIEEALSGKNVALICSGDAGVYGMSGLAFEIAAEHEISYPDEKVQISVIPGITAALSGSAILGAPLIHDFAVISLSDLMTSWERIEKRLDFASKSDFCIVLYNPMSHTRKDYLFKACQIMAKNISETTPCAYVKNIGRKGEEYKILTLKELAVCELDMFCTVFIGNSQTKVIEVNGRKQLVTPRGYVFERGEK